MSKKAVIWSDFDATTSGRPTATCGFCGKSLAVSKDDKTGYSWSAAECTCPEAKAHWANFSKNNKK